MDFNGAISFKVNFDLLAMTSKGFVDRVVDDLPQTVHEATGIGRTDVHTWALADRIQTF